MHLKNVVFGDFEYINTLSFWFSGTVAVEGKADDIKSSLDEDYNENEYNVYDMDGHDHAPDSGWYYIYITKFPMLNLLPKKILRFQNCIRLKYYFRGWRRRNDMFLRGFRYRWHQMHSRNE